MATSMLLDDSDPPKISFDFYEEQDPNNPRQKYFLIRIQMVEEAINKLQWLVESKNDRLAKIKKRQKEPDYLQKLSKFNKIKQKDQKARQEWQKDPANRSLMQELQWHNIQRQKFNFQWMQPFEWRGKNFNVCYMQRDKSIYMRIRKQYYLGEVKLSSKELFNTAISFSIIWQNDYFAMVKLLWKFYLESEQRQFYYITIRSIDMISVTFDVIYTDKKIYRFRYSPFEFKNIPYYKEEKQLTGYNQLLSCLSEISANQKAINDRQFYNAPRLFIFDDLTDNNLFLKLGQRSNLFYQIYYYTRHNSSDQDEFNKKIFLNFYFSTTRLKKFIFTWSFKTFQKPGKEKKQNLNIEEKEKQLILHLACYVSVIGTSEPFYNFKLQILDTNRVINPSIKEEMYQKFKQFLVLFRDTTSNGPRDHQYLLDRPSILKRRDEREWIGKSDFEQYELSFQLNSKDKFDKFFIGIQVIAGTILDRNYFNINESVKKDEIHKFVNLKTKQMLYSNRKKQYENHHHYLQLTLRHTYLPNMSPYIYRSDQHHNDPAYNRQAYQSQLAAYYKNPYLDTRYKLGEWKFEKLWKGKKKVNRKNQKQDEDEKYIIEQFSKVYIGYINILLRHFALRLIYKDILSFLQAISKLCYKGQEDKNDFPLKQNQYVYSKIISALIEKYYNYQFKLQKKVKDVEKQGEKDNKQRQKQMDKQEDTFNKVIVLKLLTKGDSEFVAESNLQAEITFRVLQLKQIWSPRINEGHIVIRVFNDRIEFEREYKKVYSLKLDLIGKKLDQKEIQRALEVCESQSKSIYMI